MASYGRHDLFVEYLSLQYALYMSCFVSVLGGAFFLASALYIQQDRERTNKLIKGKFDVGPCVYVQTFICLMPSGSKLGI